MAAGRGCSLYIRKKRPRARVYVWKREKERDGVHHCTRKLYTIAATRYDSPPFFFHRIDYGPCTHSTIHHYYCYYYDYYYCYYYYYRTYVHGLCIIIIIISVLLRRRRHAGRRRSLHPDHRTRTRCRPGRRPVATYRSDWFETTARAPRGERLTNGNRRDAFGFNRARVWTINGHGRLYNYVWATRTPRWSRRRAVFST